MKILIKVTKDILKRSMMCGVKGSKFEHKPASNCAIALAVRKIFPYSGVSWTDLKYAHIFLYGKEFESVPEIPLPKVAGDFIESFDELETAPEKRLLMDEISFEVDVPDEIINTIGISQVYKILSESKTLELVEP